jgi:hypothetical protein
MKKRWWLIPVIFFVVNAAYAQNTASPVTQMDSTVKALALDIHKKLVEGKAQKVILGQFGYRGSASPFASYWTNQLAGELANIAGKPYVILTEGTAGAEQIISGEIVIVANTIRVYTRLIRLEGRTIEAVFQSDFERNAALNTMLVSGGESGSSSVYPDEYEPDSWDAPVPVEIGTDENTPPMNRTLTQDDEDFFLLIPDRDGRLTVETTGNLDTYMHFYHYESRNQLGEDDDSGQGSNARIRYSVQAGTRYLAKVKGYDRSTTGNYGFRAYLTPPREGLSSWENPLPCEPGANENSAVINRRFQESGDEDFFLIVPDRDGRLTIETTGSMDTYMHLYDYADRENQLASDDDSGQNLNARIRHDVQAGKRYIVRVRDLDRGSGSYGFRAYLSPQQ